MERHFIRYGLAGMMILLMISCFPAVCGAANIGEQDIKDAVRKHVEENGQWPKDRIRVEFLGPIPEVAVSCDAASIQVRSRNGEKYIGRTAFTVRFSRGDMFLREDTVRVRIEVQMDVVVSSRGITRDAILDQSDVTMMTKWMDTATTGIIADINEVLGRKATVRINPGTEITKHMLRSVPVVKKGEIVRIVLESGPMVISAVGLCQEDGGQGDLIRVQNTSSRKVVFARVMGQSLVKVDF
jgi:flagella basal body P-ring formation protein FlgA